MILEEKSINVNFIQSIVNDVLKEFPLKIEQYQNGRTGIVNMLMGEIKKRTLDRYDAHVANELLMKKLAEVLK